MGRKGKGKKEEERRKEGKTDRDEEGETQVGREITFFS